MCGKTKNLKFNLFLFFNLRPLGENTDKIYRTKILGCVKMRTIGQKRIIFVRKLTELIIANNPYKGYNSISTLVIKAVPDKYFHIWEGAYSQIENIIMDVWIKNHVYK